jgi:hypothetical protein
MKIYFCPECGSYSHTPDPYCIECHSYVPNDTWAEVTDEELHQLEYIEEIDMVPGLPVWEYDVVRLKSDDDAGGIHYISAVLNRMGEKGWELVNVTPLGNGDSPRYGVFKRCWMGDIEE